MKAMIGQLAATGARRTHLYFGARSLREAYDQEALTALENRYGWLSVVTAISDDTRWKGRQGLIGEVAADDGDWAEHDAYVCGSPAMVEASVKRLLAVGVLEERVRFEEFGEA